MRYKLLNNRPKTYVLVFDTGDEVMDGITTFAKEQGLEACSVSGIGAFSSAELGYFDFDIKDYKKIPITEQVEVLSLLGDISMYEGKPILHAHIVVGKADGSAHGGHLLKAWVKPTLEVIITALPAHLQREMNQEVGIPLIKL